MYIRAAGGKHNISFEAIKIVQQHHFSCGHVALASFDESEYKLGGEEFVERKHRSLPTHVRGADSPAYAIHKVSYLKPGTCE